MALVNTYCQVGFLEHLFEVAMKISLLDPYYKEVDQAIDLIQNKSYVLLDDSQRLTSLVDENPFFLRLIKAIQEGGSEIINFKQEFPNLMRNGGEGLIHIAEKSSIHLWEAFPNEEFKSLTDLAISTAKEEEWGPVIENLSLKRVFKVHRDKNINTFPGWQVLEEINLPTNSVIITDQYILKDREKLERNLFSILRAILPSNINQPPFQITLVVSPDTTSLEEKYEEIRSFIQSLKLPYPTKLQIVQNTYHDRFIIANYFYAISGHSLDYYNTNGNINKSTDLRIYGLIAEPGNPISVTLQELKPLILSPYRRIGETFRNRLL